MTSHPRSSATSWTNAPIDRPSGSDRRAPNSRATQQLGLHVPQDLAIVSHGDVFYSRGSEPPLATVSFDYKKLGVMTVETLFEMIEHPDSIPEPVVFTEQFFPRGSIITAGRS